MNGEIDRNRRRTCGSWGTTPGRREVVAALAERGRRSATQFPSVNQAGPTRSATTSTAAPGLFPSYDSEAQADPVLRNLKGLQVGKFSLPGYFERSPHAGEVGRDRCASIDLVFPKQKRSCPRDREGA